MKTLQGEKKFAVVAVMARDRIGLIDEVTEILKGTNVNLERAYAARLGGLYGAYLLVSGTNSTEGSMKETLEKNLAPFDPRIHECAEPISTPMNYTLSLYAFDAKGIVSTVARLLRSHGVDVVGVTGSADAAPHCGGSLFCLQMNLSLGADVSLSSVGRDLSELADRKGWDIDLESICERHPIGAKFQARPAQLSAGSIQDDDKVH